MNVQRIAIPPIPAPIIAPVERSERGGAVVLIGAASAVPIDEVEVCRAVESVGELVISMLVLELALPLPVAAVLALVVDTTKLPPVPDELPPAVVVELPPENACVKSHALHAACPAFPISTSCVAGHFCRRQGPARLAITDCAEELQPQERSL